jgi:hypothetical protein
VIHISHPKRKELGKPRRGTVPNHIYNRAYASESHDEKLYQIKLETAHALQHGSNDVLKERVHEICKENTYIEEITHKIVRDKNLRTFRVV